MASTDYQQGGTGSRRGSVASISSETSQTSQTSQSGKGSNFLSKLKSATSGSSKSGLTNGPVHAQSTAQQPANTPPLQPTGQIPNKGMPQPIATSIARPPSSERRPSNALQSPISPSRTPQRPPAAPSASWRQGASPIGSFRRPNPTVLPRGSWRNDANYDSPEHTAQRLRTLPRLASYSSVPRVPQVKSVGSPIYASPSSYRSNVGREGFSSATEDSGASTTDDNETEEEEDEEGHQSDEEVADHPPTPNNNNINQTESGGTWANYSGWTTFAASSPTPMPTARASASVNEDPSVSYFDIRPHGDRTSPQAARTPQAFLMGLTSRSAQAAHLPSANRDDFQTRGTQRMEADEMLEREASVSALPSPIGARPQTDESEHRDRSGSVASITSSQSSTSELSSEGEGEEERESVASEETPYYDRPPPTPVAGIERQAKPSSFTKPKAENKDQPPVYHSIPLAPGLHAPVEVLSKREEEGREDLPDYSCAVHIEGWMPRKVEFTEPGKQANNRAWKHQYIILHGTSLKVCTRDPEELPGRPVQAAPTSIRLPSDGQPVLLENSATASGNSTSASSYRNASNASNNRGGSNASVGSNGSRRSSLTASTASSHSNLSSLAEEANDDSRADKISGMSENNQANATVIVNVGDSRVPVHRGTREMHVHQGHYDGAAPGRSTALLTKALRKESGDVVVRHYTMQGAESGLAADYLKRKHCVRVRAEGEQFLIQAADDRGVIDWIEAVCRLMVFAHELFNIYFSNSYKRQLI